MRFSIRSVFLSSLVIVLTAASSTPRMRDAILGSRYPQGTANTTSEEAQSCISNCKAKARSSQPSLEKCSDRAATRQVVKCIFEREFEAY